MWWHKPLPELPHPKVAELDRRLAMCVRVKLDSAGETRLRALAEIDRLLDLRRALTGRHCHGR